MNMGLQNTSVPDSFESDLSEFTKESFLTPDPYDYLYQFVGSQFVFETKANMMNTQAKKVGFTGFKMMLKKYLETRRKEQRTNALSNQTSFDGQALELDCGQWESADWGIFRDSPNGGKDCACAHPIMPVERLVNIDSNEVKIKLAYKRSGKDKKWNTVIVSKDTIATSKSIVGLASCGISVTSSTASTLVDYLNDMENLNYEIIPEMRSISRLGYIPGEGFSPYIDGLVFDGDACYSSLYNSVSSKGSVGEWWKIANECRHMSTEARIILASSFASPLLSIVGSLPFFVHLWGVDSGTGKTVALMLAASVWGNPALGSYIQTFNATQVGQERTAAFLNHLPFCIDELQLTKDSKGKSNFDVYQLAQGVGRSRGKRVGGIEATPTWSCCFLTSGESPLTSVSSGAGAVNRVIDVECTAGNVVITDGARVANALKQNYGFAGYTFVNKIYESQSAQDQIKTVYRDYFEELSKCGTTEKQAMAAAVILTADFLASAYIFDDQYCLSVDDIKNFLASKQSVSAGKRAYDYLCDWIAGNANHFSDGSEMNLGETFGKIENNTAFIINSIFTKVLTDAGFNRSATLSYLKSEDLIDARSDKKVYTKGKRINGILRECVVLKLPTLVDDDENYDELPL